MTAETLLTCQYRLVATRNDVKISYWKAPVEAGMTFSTDVSAALEILSIPELQILHHDKKQA
jgi:hypothetical protein